MFKTTIGNSIQFVRQLIKSPVLWIGLVTYSFYHLFALVFPTNAMLEASSVLVLIGGVAIILSWGPSFVYGVLNGARIGSWQLPVAIVLTWVGTSERHIWSVAWRFTGQPEWMLHSHFVGQANWLIFLSSALYIVAPGNETGQVPVKNWYVLLVAVGAAMFAAGAVITALVLRPDL